MRLQLGANIDTGSALPRKIERITGAWFPDSPPSLGVSV